MDFEKQTVPELKALAKKIGISGSDSMKKAELVSALMSHDGGKEAKPVAEKQAEKSGSENSDYASHPKFAKFKSIQGAE